MAPAGETAMVSTFTGPAVYTEAEKYQKVDFSAIADNKAKFAKTADNGWLAMVQHYFVAAFVPKEKTAARVLHAQAGRRQRLPGWRDRAGRRNCAGCQGRTAVGLYAGPQEQAALKQVAAGPRPGGRLRLADRRRRTDLLGAGSHPQAGRQLGLGDRRPDHWHQGRVLSAVCRVATSRWPR